jgi:hypothetical protein
LVKEFSREVPSQPPLQEIGSVTDYSLLKGAGGFILALSTFLDHIMPISNCAFCGKKVH